MVFVSTLLLLSMVVTLVVGLSHAVFFEKLSIYSKDTWNRFANVYLNVFYLYMLIFIVSFQTSLSWKLAGVLLVLMTYFQPNEWSHAMEERLVKLHEAIRKATLDRLLDEDCIITQYTLPRYLWALFVSGFHNFKDVFSEIVEDARILTGSYEIPYKTSKVWKEIYEAKKRFFKYIVIDFELLANPYGSASWEKIMKDGERAKKNRDPRIAFNRVRRLPWKFTYTDEPNLYFHFSTKHILVLYNFFKTTMLSVFLMFIYFLYTIFFFKIQFLKQLSVWFVIGMLYFWLMSGFNFFVKRYQYGKFTSQIQRFWKRANASFWLIEGFLILLFFYYYLNSSQEPLYMYDYSAINQEFLISLQTIGVNIILLSLVIYFMYFTLLRINSNAWSQLNVYLLLISVFIFFSFFIETYQFYYVISTFNERLWVLNEEENLWGIETDNPIMRTKHQYLFVCLIAKYWHFLFIFLSWVFFLIKSFERRKVTFVLFGANLQNMIILYVLNFACYLQWFKWVYRRFFDLPYTWFFANIDNKFIFRLFFELKLLLLNLFSFNTTLTTYSSVVYKSLSLWNVDSLCMWKFL